MFSLSLISFRVVEIMFVERAKDFTVIAALNVLHILDTHVYTIHIQKDFV